MLLIVSSRSSCISSFSVITETSYPAFSNFDASICAPFVCLSVKFIRAICAAKFLHQKTLTILDIAEVARMYSSEIEYSDENLDALLCTF